MRRLLVALMLVVGMVGVAVADDVRTFAVHCTATLSHVVAANPNRLGLVVQNVGTLHVNVGRGALGLTLHAGASLSMSPQYRGGLECQTQPGSGTTILEVLEEVR